jgi:hypothetical protein
VAAPEGELKNLLKDHADIAARLDSKLKAWSATLKPPGPPEPHNEQDNMFFATHVDKTISQAGRRGAPAKAASSTPESVAGIQGWICRNGTLSMKDGALRLTPDASLTGNSRAFLTHSQLDLPGPVTAVMKLRAVDPGNGHASITWRTRSESFEPHQSVLFDWPVQKDWQEVRVELPEKSRIIHLRINPPQGSTGIEIQSIHLQGQGGKSRAFRFDTK